MSLLISLISLSIAINYMVSTGYTHKTDDMLEGITKVRIDSSGNKLDNNPVVIDRENGQVTVDQLVREIEAGEGCRVAGTFEMRKVAGQIEIISERHFGVLNSLKITNPEAFSKFSFEHRMEEFYWGDKSQMASIKELFSDHPEHIKFDLMQEPEFIKQ